MARIGFPFVATRSPPNDTIQDLTFNSSANSTSDTLGLDLVLVFMFTLHPIEISTVSACEVIVAVNQHAHVALRVVKHRRAPGPVNKADVVQVPR